MTKSSGVRSSPLLSTQALEHTHPLRRHKSSFAPCTCIHQIASLHLSTHPGREGPKLIASSGNFYRTLRCMRGSCQDA